MTPTPAQQHDVLVVGAGSVWTFTPVSDEAKDWTVDHVQLESYQWLGRDTFVVEHRFAGALVEGYADAGFRVRVE